MKILFAIVATVCRAFKPIDWEAMTKIEPEPVHLQMKTFTTDGLDVESPILAEGQRDVAEFQHEKEVMDKSFSEMREGLYKKQRGLPNLEHINYVPRLRKLDLETN